MMQDTVNRPLFSQQPHATPCVQAPDENDPLFENLVRCVVRHCMHFVELHGGGLDVYYIGAAHDAQQRLLEFHQVSGQSPHFIRDGLHFSAARSILQQMILKGCRGVGYVEADDTMKLYMYKTIPGVTVEDD